jgi:hypothetical protein
MSVVADAEPTPHPTWSWLFAGILVVGVIVGSLVSFHGQPNAPWPTSGLVTLTGYGQLRVASPSSDPTSVVLTSAQVQKLDDVVSALPKAKEANCYENAAVFTISFASRAGEASSAVATDWECPAPGVLALHTPSGTHELLGGVCRLKTFVDRTFSGDEAKGSKQELLRWCR